ncbi:MAG TPA: hypothetical protein VN461_10105 [Vicinamibacteria bacterium]|nr:hypothetical protein [Vicinamibacteria bacterium]
MRTASLLLALLAATGAAQAQFLLPPPPPPTAPLKLKVGDATVFGGVGFTLMTTSNGDTLRVDLALGPMMASDKAIALQKTIAVLDPWGTWRAVTSAAELTFQHLIAGTWQTVDSISNITDTTGGGTVLETAGAAVDFHIDIDPTAVASGTNAMGNPSFLSVSLTDTLSWTYAVQPGDTAQSILNLLQAFLATQGGAGVTVSRPSLTTISIKLQYNISSLTWNLTDTGLLSLSPTVAGVVDR